MTIIWIASAYIPSWVRPGRWKIAGLGIGDWAGGGTKNKRHEVREKFDEAGAELGFIPSSCEHFYNLSGGFMKGYPKCYGKFTYPLVILAMDDDPWWFSISQTVRLPVQSCELWDKRRKKAWMIWVHLPWIFSMTPVLIQFFLSIWSG